MTDLNKNTKTIGDRLKESREIKGYTQGQLADMTEVIAKGKGLRKGVSQQVISKLERNLSDSSKGATLLASALDIDPIWLIDGENQKTKIKESTSEYDISGLMNVATPNSHRVLERIQKAFDNGSITEEDLQAIEAIAERFIKE